VVPAAPQTYTATYSVSSTPVPIAFVQVKAFTPQAPQSTVATAFNTAQSAGNLNVAVIGWNEAAGNITSVTDSAGNTYQVAVPTFRGSGLSQAVYYAKDIVGAASNTITVRFDKAVAYADVRILEYRGLDQTSPFDVGRSAAGTAATANSGAATTTFANELVFGGGITTGGFSAAGTGFTARIITSPDGDIAEDRIVTTTGSYSSTARVSGAWIMQMPPSRAPASSRAARGRGAYPTTSTGWRPASTADPPGSSGATGGRGSRLPAPCSAGLTRRPLPEWCGRPGPCRARPRACCACRRRPPRRAAPPPAPARPPAPACAW
jgi:hypothetical protein